MTNEKVPLLSAKKAKSYSEKEVVLVDIEDFIEFDSNK